MLYYIGKNMSHVGDDAEIFVYDTDDWTLERVLLSDIVKSGIGVAGVYPNTSVSMRDGRHYSRCTCLYFAEGGYLCNGFGLLISDCSIGFWKIFLPHGEYFALTVYGDDIYVCCADEYTERHSLTGMVGFGWFVLLKDGIAYFDGSSLLGLELPIGKGVPYSYSRAKKETIYGGT